MNTHKIDGNTVPENSPTGKARGVKPPRMEIPPAPVEKPGLVVVPSPDPPG